MKNKVFISGSISIKRLPREVIESLDNIIEKNIAVLVGDAEGIDSLIQEYFLFRNYFNVTVYSITSAPRNISSSDFKNKYIFVPSEIKKERQRQQEKDKAMTADSQYSLVVWDGKSKGSYANIIRAIEQNKKIKIYLSTGNYFIKTINKNEIDFIYRQSNGYTASEVIEYLQNELFIEKFKRTQDLNKYLLEKNILLKENDVYTPNIKYEEYFIIERYKGKTKGVKFKNEFISFIQENLENKKLQNQGTLF